jgi:intermediate cleaving peptidase 55
MILPLTKQDEVLVGKEHATVLTVNAPKEVGFNDFEALVFATHVDFLQIADVEGACQGLLGLEPF